MIYNAIHNTTPVAVHLTGIKNRGTPHGPPIWMYEDLREVQLSSRGLTTQLEIITALSPMNEPPTDMTLVDQMQKFNIPITVMGRGYDKEWRNIFKIKLYLDALYQEGPPFVMMLDSFDVLFQRHPDLALNRFLKNFYNRGVKALFNGTCNDYPLMPACKLFEESLANQDERFWFPYLNSGAIIAERNFAIDMLEFTKSLNTNKYPFGDQHRYRIAHAMMWPEIEVDRRTQIFMTTKAAGQELAFKRIQRP